ncbi:MAG TPA: ATP-dependent DNA helicase [Patescibacteria group bacterium]|nr:ATP-dependent DNA helicase [Patescibacteria group bacterium]
MNTEVFDKQYKTLNPLQKQAVDTIEGPVMVIAGPGTGKTQILTLRIANILLKSQVNPQNILALTFTESAVAAMRKRLVAFIGTPAYRVEINTFHGFCNDIIKRFPDNFQSLIAADSITEIEQIQIIEEIITNNDFTILKPIGDTLYYIRSLLSAINELKKESVTPQNFLQGLGEMEKDIQQQDDLYHTKGPHKGKMKGMYGAQLKNIAKNKEVAKAYELYEKMLTEKKAYDFNDMLLVVNKTLQHTPDVLLQLQEQYQYILVDEHQDTNASQNILLELLTSFHPSPNLFVVGDEKQAIYRFQGASLENFLYFQKKYPAASLITLTENYRSTQTILDTAIGMMGKSNVLPGILGRGVQLTSQKTFKEKKISVAQLSTYESEFAWVVTDMQKNIANGISPSTIAVLVRKNKDIVPLVNFFDLLRIPYVIESDQDILTDFAIQQLITILRATENIGSDEELILAFHCNFFHIDAMDIYRLLVYSQENKTSIWELLTVSKKTDIQLISRKNIQRTIQLLQKWHTDTSNMPFDQFMKIILQESSLLVTLLQENNGLIHLENIKRLFQEVYVRQERNPLFSLSDFLRYIDTLQEHHIRIQHTPTIQKNGVHILTAHKAKGLEFDYVYILQLFEGHWGNARKGIGSIVIPWSYLKRTLELPTKEDIYEDERRLFFVALTRAKKHITISYATHSIDGKEQIPSLFLSEIDQQFVDYLQTDDFEQQFVLNPSFSLMPTATITTKQKEQAYEKHKQFFWDLFMKRGLSPTGLDNYLECPRKYFFVNLLNIPDVPTEKELFGRVIHHALGSFFRKTLPDRTKEYLLQRFSMNVKELPVPPLMKRRLQTEGEKILTGFYENTIVHINTNVMSELLVRGVTFDNDIILKGRVDLLEKHEADNTYIIHDFKVSKPISRNAMEGLAGDKNYKRQLLFYKLMLEKMGKYQVTNGIIDFVEPDEKGRYKSELFSLEEKDIEALKTLLRKIANEIRNLSFLEKGCEKTDCRYCKLGTSISSSLNE